MSRTRSAVDFRRWIRRHRKVVELNPLRHVIHMFGYSIPMSAAYRAALAEGLRGRRRNRSRYALFWARINWALPDLILSRVWGTARQNIRQRRQLLRAGVPRWRLPSAQFDAAYRRALRREHKRSVVFVGQRPR